jgi:hypothetical protein
LCECERARQGKRSSKCNRGEFHSRFLGLVTKVNCPERLMFRQSSAR